MLRTTSTVGLKGNLCNGSVCWVLPQMQRGSGANLPCLLQPGSWESPEWLELSLGHCVLENHLKNIPESLENGGTINYGCF